MILGIGVDIVETARIASSLARFEQRFVSKILSPEESLRYQKRHPDAAWLARRFAAKEATAKALQTGMKQGVHFRQISVGRAKGGAPSVSLTGAAAERAEAMGVSNIQVSISDEVHYAVSFVVLEGQAPRYTVSS